VIPVAAAIMTSTVLAIVPAGAQVQSASGVENGSLTSAPIIVDGPVDIAVVDGENGRGLDRGRLEAGRRHIGQPIDHELAVVVCEAPNRAIGPFEPPAGRKRGHPAGEMPGKRSRSGFQGSVSRGCRVVRRIRAGLSA
jgi:hypothetical protein